MSNVSEILNAFFKSVEYSGATNLGVSKIEQDLYALLKSHAVIDKDCAETCTEAVRAERRRTEGVSGMEYLERDEVKLNTELSRLSTTHKGK